MNKEEIKALTLKSFMYSALFWSFLSFCEDRVNYAIWLLLLAIFIRMEFRSDVK